MIPFPHQKNKLLSELSTLGVGGAARYLAEARSIGQMQRMMAYAHKASMPILILGKGSNCLFDDRGFAGLVVLNRIDFLNQDEGYFTAGSGYSFARLGQLTARKGYTGLEFASGIPASVGGAIFMNAGAAGMQTADVLLFVDYITKEGERIRLKRADLNFAYRASPFQEWGGAIAAGVFQLGVSDVAKAEQRKHLAYRLKTQPYGDKSAGCAFRNPAGRAAGKLIEECGLKGFQIGGAIVSMQHANFIVNSGGATSRDIALLLDTIKQKVQEEKGIFLEEEVRYIPYE